MDDQETRDQRLSDIRKRLAPLVAKKGSKTHGLSKLKEYTIWVGMKARCADMSNQNYGGRGIKVCDRWSNDFVAFISDMGFRPSPLHEIERSNNDGDYEPDNCCWATRQEQMQNQRKRSAPRRKNPTTVMFNGVEQSVDALCKQRGVTKMLFYNRVNSGWTVERALSPPHLKVGRSRVEREIELARETEEAVFRPRQTWRKACSAKPW